MKSKIITPQIGKGLMEQMRASNSTFYKAFTEDSLSYVLLGMSGNTDHLDGLKLLLPNLITYSHLLNIHEVLPHVNSHRKLYNGIKKLIEEYEL